MNLYARYAIAFTAAILGCACAVLAFKISATVDKDASFTLLHYDRPILKIDPSFFVQSFVEKKAVVKKEEPQGPRITARSYLVGNVQTGKIYIKSNSTQPLPVASMSKLVTAIAATDMLAPDTNIRISDQDTNLPPDTTNLYKDEKFTLSELLYPMLVASSNVAAQAISDSMSDRIQFTDAMTQYAREIGMPQAFFADPSGLNPQNVASAEGMFTLAKYLYKYRPDILAITRTGAQIIATTSDHGSHEIISTHPFVSDSRFIGGKTGRTPEAGETMMTILNIDGKPVAFIVLGSEYGTREWDTRTLIDQYKTATLAAAVNGR